MPKSQLGRLKVAIVHDSLIEAGGAEKVLGVLLKIFPSADLYTSLSKPIPQLKRIQKRVKKSWAGIPFIDNRKTITKLLVHFYWENLDLSEYSLVISSSDVFSSKSVITSPKTLHVSYCHTPAKFLYPEYPGVDENKQSLPLKTKLLLLAIRAYDFITAQRPDIFIANSQTVKERIKKYYQRDAVVIYPPVSIPSEKPKRHKVGDYYVFVGKLQGAKGVKLAIEACNRLKKKLVVIGDGWQGQELERLVSDQVKLTGYVSEKAKINYLKRARGFLFPAIDEDFGIAPVEAMAHGVPVIAFYSGGLKETIIDGKTGIFFKDFTKESLAQAVMRFEKMKFDPLDCYKQAKKFSEERFKKELKKYIGREYARHAKRINK